MYIYIRLWKISNDNMKVVKQSKLKYDDDDNLSYDDVCVSNLNRVEANFSLQLTDLVGLSAVNISQLFYTCVVKSQLRDMAQSWKGHIKYNSGSRPASFYQRTCCTPGEQRSACSKLFRLSLITGINSNYIKSLFSAGILCCYRKLRIIKGIITLL